MLVIPHCPSDRCDPDTSHVDVPSIDGMALRYVDQQSLLIGAAIHDLYFRESDALFVSRSGGYARHHHQLDELLAFSCQLPTFRLFQAVFRRRNVLVREGFEKLSTDIRSHSSKRWSGGKGEKNAPPAACPAKTPSPWPGRGTGTCAHDARRCIVGWADPNRRGQPRQTPT